MLANLIRVFVTSTSPLHVVAMLQVMTTDDVPVTVPESNWTTCADSIDGDADAPILPLAICIGVLLASIALGAVVGNALVVLSVLTNPKLRTLTNRFVASLACADLAVGALVMPLAVKVEVTGTWRLGRTLCDVWISLDVLLCTASILNLCAISVDRYLAVTRPLQTFTGSWRSRRVANSMIGGAWLAAVIITCPPLFGWREADRESCNVCTLTRDPGYIIYSALGSFYVPLAVMLVLYGNIFKVTRNRLPADGRLRRFPASRHESDDGQTIPGTPLTDCITSRLTTTPPATAHQDHRQQAAREEGSSGSSDSRKDVVSRAIPEHDGECMEMTPLETDRQRTSIPMVSRHDASCRTARARYRAAPSLCAMSTVKHRAARRSVSTLTQYSTTSSVSEVRYSLSSPEWRRTVGSTTADACVRRENKAAKTLAIVVGGFVICWMPFFLLYVVEPFCDSCHVSDALRSVLTWLGYANSLVNPFIYATYNRHFRRSFWHLTVGRFHVCLRRGNRQRDVVSRSPIVL